MRAAAIPHVSEASPAFAKAARVLQKIEADHATITARHAARLQRLADHAPPVAAGGAIERVEALQAGGPIDANQAALAQLRDDDVRDRRLLEVVPGALHEARAFLERARGEAWATEYAARSSVIAERFKAAAGELLATMRADDALLGELIAAGFGGGSPLATMLHVGIARELFALRLAEAARGERAAP